MPSILDQWQPIPVYNPDTLAFEMWNGSLKAGALTIGKVDQGAAGASAWVMALPSGASTEATLAAIKTQTDKLAFTGSLLQTSASLVGGAGNGAILDGVNPLLIATVTAANALKVDGSAVTQPVSGPLTDAQLRAVAVPVSGTVTANAGTGTQAVSLATLPALVAGTANIGDVDVLTIAAGDNNIGNVDIVTMPAITGTVTANAGTNLNTSALALDASISTLNTSVNTLLKPANTLAAVTTVGTITNAVSVTPPTLTKGTQGATGFSVQRLQDAGRTAISLFATGVTAGASATEAMVTLTRSTVAGAATSAASTFVITSGKTFRITAVMVACRNMAATTASTIFTLRINTAGATVTTSAAALQLRCATPATINSWDRAYLDLLDGVDIAGNGTLQFGLSVNPTWTTTASQYDATITGFEY